MNSERDPQNKVFAPLNLDLDSFSSLRKGKVVMALSEVTTLLKTSEILLPLEKKQTARITSLHDLNELLNNEGQPFKPWSYHEVQTIVSNDPAHPGHFYQLILCRRGAARYITTIDQVTRTFSTSSDSYHRVTLHPELGFRLLGQGGCVYYLLDGKTGNIAFELGCLNVPKFELDEDELLVYDRDHGEDSHQLKKSVTIKQVKPLSPLILNQILPARS